MEKVRLWEARWPRKVTQFGGKRAGRDQRLCLRNLLWCQQRVKNGAGMLLSPSAWWKLSFSVLWTFSIEPLITNGRGDLEKGVNQNHGEGQATSSCLLVLSSGPRAVSHIWLMCQVLHRCQQTKGECGVCQRWKAKKCLWLRRGLGRRSHLPVTSWITLKTMFSKYLLCTRSLSHVFNYISSRDTSCLL